MTIKFEKEITLTGDICYRIYADNVCIKSFISQWGEGNTDAAFKAKEFFDGVVQRAKEGYPITTIVYEETITPKP